MDKEIRKKVQAIKKEMMYEILLVKLFQEEVDEIIEQKEKERVFKVEKILGNKRGRKVIEPEKLNDMTNIDVKSLAELERNLLELKSLQPEIKGNTFLRKEFSPFEPE